MAAARSGTGEMDAILQTIREVESSLDRRSARAGAVVMMTWGAVATGIFLFYGVARGPFDALDGLPPRVLHWAWAPPMLVGYLLTALTQVRLGRMRATAGASSVRRLLLLLLAPIAILVLAVTTHVGWQLIPAMWVAFLGYTHIAWRTDAGWAHRGIAVASFALALVLALPPLWEWAWLGAAAWYGVFLLGHGVYRYHTA